MLSTKIDALIFDCDGVIVDSETIHIAVELELLSEIGLTYDYEIYLSRFVGLSIPDYYAALNTDYYSKYGKKFPSSFADELYSKVWPKIERDLKSIIGIAPLASQFEGKVAVASSSPIDRLHQKLSIANLLDIFSPHIYSADHVTKGKPAPDLFLYAADALNVNPRNCAVIEDSVNGIKASCSAGMTAIGFVGGGHADLGLELRLKNAGAIFVTESHAKIASFLNSKT